MRVGLISAALVLVLAPGWANAALIEAEFEAVITGGNVGGDHRFTGTFAWDTETEPTVIGSGDADPFTPFSPPAGTTAFVLDAAKLGPELSIAPRGAFRRPDAIYLASLPQSVFPQSDFAISFNAHSSFGSFSLGLIGPGLDELPAELSLDDFSGGRIFISGPLTFSGVLQAELTSLTTRPIPEPASVLAFVVGLAVVGVACRRR